MTRVRVLHPLDGGILLHLHLSVSLWNVRWSGQQLTGAAIADSVCVCTCVRICVCVCLRAHRPWAAEHSRNKARGDRDAMTSLSLSVPLCYPLTNRMGVWSAGCGVWTHALALYQTTHWTWIRWSHKPVQRLKMWSVCIVNVNTNIFNSATFSLGDEDSKDMSMHLRYCSCSGHMTFE